jgi:predicted membrane GTPase involved in stress response
MWPENYGVENETDAFSGRPWRIAVGILIETMRHEGFRTTVGRPACSAPMKTARAGTH